MRFLTSDSQPSDNELRIGDQWQDSSGLVRKLVSTNPHNWQQVYAPPSSSTWNNISDKPLTFTPSAHAHQATQVSNTIVTVSYAAVPTFDLSLGRSFRLTLTGNVTGQTFVGQNEGDEITLLILQDGLGLRTWLWHASVVGAVAISTVANKKTVQRLQWDGSTWNAISLGIAGI